MYFKPRVFVSSTLDLAPLRRRIQQVLSSIGSEPLIYETNLTPSTTPSTYRADMSVADFAVFILDKRYGSVTDTGLSGTHEEWIIAQELKIPSHVYVRASVGEEGLERFKQENIEGQGVSYFKYSHPNQIVRRLRESAMAIGRAATLHSMSRGDVPRGLVARWSLEQVHASALYFVAGVDDILSADRFQSLVYDTSAVTMYLDVLEGHVLKMEEEYIDSRIPGLVRRAFIAGRDFGDLHTSSHSATVGEPGKDFVFGREVIHVVRVVREPLEMAMPELKLRFGRFVNCCDRLKKELRRIREKIDMLALRSS